MALPPSGELSRWTVSHVSDWLTKCSLSAFRGDFLSEAIDGSKLMQLTPYEVNQRYRHISSKKRNILIGHLKEIQSSHQPPMSNAAPQIPPRNSRIPPAQSSPQYDDSDRSDGSWSDDFDQDDYLEPVSKPLDNEHHTHAGSGINRNVMPDGPEETYEIPEEDLEEIRQQPQRGFERKPTIVDKLRNELAVFKERKGEQAAVAPPPRPPRGNRTGAGDSQLVERRFEAHPKPSPHHDHSPHPHPPVNTLPPEDEYEVMNDVITETQKAHNTVPQPRGTDAHFSPKPTNRVAKERPPEPQTSEKPAPRNRYAYTEVKKPGLQVQGDELSVYDWYHGEIGRDHAQKIIAREQKNGMFLIRKSERDPKQPYTLVLWHCNRIWNIQIRKKDNGKFAAGKHKEGESGFSSVPEIVDHFKVVSLNLMSDAAIQGSHTLTHPAPKH